MATNYGALAGPAFDEDNASYPEKINVNDWGGRVRAMMDSYEASAVASGDYVVLGRVPKGARILPHTNVTHDALGGSTTVSLVLLNTDDGTTEQKVLLAAAASSSAGIKSGNAATSIDDFPYEVTQEAFYCAKIGGAAATGTMKGYLFYVAD